MRNVASSSQPKGIAGLRLLAARSYHNLLVRTLLSNILLDPLPFGGSREVPALGVRLKRPDGAAFGMPNRKRLGFIPPDILQFLDLIRHMSHLLDRIFADQDDEIYETKRLI